jgi:Rieske 2Fe-2S family protein
LDAPRAERALDLIRLRRPGYTLAPICYRDPDLFALERARIFQRSWLVVGHESTLPDAGSVSPRTMADAPVVVVRDHDRVLRMFHNTCQHRGSVVCEANAQRDALVCPYHQWTYDLRGQLVAARTVPDAAQSGVALASCATRPVSGLLLAAVGRASDEEVDAIARALTPVLDWYRFEDLRPAHSETFAMAANWKLVIENFDECYHCWPGHPEYSKLMAHAKAEALGDEAGGHRFEALRETFRARLSAGGCPTEDSPPRDDRSFWLVHLPLLEGFCTQSSDGQQVAPFVHAGAAELSGVVSIRIGFLAHLLLSPDHAVLFRFHPRAAEATDVELTWLIRETGVTPTADEVAKLTDLWRVTTEQDARFLASQQRGLSSPAARAGAYVDAEEYCEHFLARYMREMLASSGPA